MKPMLQSPSEFSGASWQLLGEIELPDDAFANGLIQTWLVESLRPLNLNERFLNKILTSARHRAERDVQSADLTPSRHIHMMIFTPVNSLSKRQTWGFCRIEKMERSQEVNPTFDRFIEFYLYPEGKQKQD